MLKVLNENTLYFNKIKESLDYKRELTTLHIKDNRFDLEKNSIIFCDDNISVKFKEDIIGNTMVEVIIVLTKLYLDYGYVQKYEYWFIGEDYVLSEPEGTLLPDVLLKCEGVDGAPDSSIEVNLRDQTYSIFTWSGVQSYE